MSTVVVRPPRRVPDVSELVAVGRAQGLDAVGIAPALPFATTRRHLERRRAAGLHAGMAFTYRRPDRSSDPGRALPGARAIVVGARSYRRVASPSSAAEGGPSVSAGSTRPAVPRGRVARYAWEDHYTPLRAALTVVARELEAAGWRCRVVADDNALVDREAAYRAGIGWYGKNTNLLLPDRGSWFVLGSVVTDAPLAARGRPLADGCGSCTRCIDGCPTGAIIAPGVVDARRCLAWLLQIEGPFPRDHRVALGDRLYGCDDCQEVCPPNHRTDRVEPATGAAPDSQPVVDLIDMLAASNDELMARYGRWYVPRREARYLRRNALVVLGNVADPRDPAVEATLCRALANADQLVRAHAVWAARRLGRSDLLTAVAGVADDTDPLVRAELEAAVDARVPPAPTAPTPVRPPTG